MKWVILCHFERYVCIVGSSWGYSNPRIQCVCSVWKKIYRLLMLLIVVNAFLCSWIRMIGFEYMTSTNSRWIPWFIDYFAWFDYRNPLIEISFFWYMHVLASLMVLAYKGRLISIVYYHRDCALLSSLLLFVMLQLMPVLELGEQTFQKKCHCYHDLKFLSILSSSMLFIKFGSFRVRVNG